MRKSFSNLNSVSFSANGFGRKTSPNRPLTTNTKKQNEGFSRAESSNKISISRMSAAYCKRLRKKTAVLNLFVGESRENEGISFARTA